MENIKIDTSSKAYSKALKTFFAQEYNADEIVQGLLQEYPSIFSELAVKSCPNEIPPYLSSVVEHMLLEQEGDYWKPAVIPAIKMVRGATKLGLKESKNLVDAERERLGRTAEHVDKHNKAIDQLIDEEPTNW